MNLASVQTEKCLQYNIYTQMQSVDQVPLVNAHTNRLCFASHDLVTLLESMKFPKGPQVNQLKKNHLGKAERRQPELLFIIIFANNIIFLMIWFSKKIPSANGDKQIITCVELNRLRLIWTRTKRDVDD